MTLYGPGCPGGQEPLFGYTASSRDDNGIACAFIPVPFQMTACANEAAPPALPPGAPGQSSQGFPGTLDRQHTSLLARRLNGRETVFFVKVLDH